MVATAINTDGRVVTYTLTPEEMAARDAKLIADTVAATLQALNPAPDASTYVKAPQAIKLLAQVKKLSPNTVFKYCMDNGINAKTIGNGAKRSTYTYNELDIYNHVKNHTHGR